MSGTENENQTGSATVSAADFLQKPNKTWEFPNSMSRWGMFLIVIGFLSGDILKLIGWGAITQQIALTLALCFLGLGLIVLGGFKSIMLRLDKILDVRSEQKNPAGSGHEPAG